MIISKKRFELQLHERWLDGMLTGKNEILNLIRDSEKVVIVHGDFRVKDSAEVKNCSVFVKQEEDLLNSFRSNGIATEKSEIKTSVPD